MRKRGTVKQSLTVSYGAKARRLLKGRAFGVERCALMELKPNVIETLLKLIELKKGGPK